MKVTTMQRLSLACALLAVSLLSCVGCGGSGKQAALLAQRREQQREQHVRQEHVREANALKDYNSGQ